MRKIRFQPGLHPGSRWEAHSAPTAPSDTLAGLRGTYFLGEAWKGGKSDDADQHQSNQI